MISLFKFGKKDTGESDKFYRFTYVVPNKPYALMGKRFPLQGRDPQELLYAEMKAVNYTGQPGPGGHPPDGHGGSYFIPTWSGGHASIPFKDRDQTIIVIDILTTGNFER